MSEKKDIPERTQIPSPNSNRAVLDTAEEIVEFAQREENRCGCPR